MLAALHMAFTETVASSFSVAPRGRAPTVTSRASPFTSSDSPRTAEPPPAGRRQFSASLSALPALSDTPDDGPMAMRSPVRGLRPSRSVKACR